MPRRHQTPAVAGHIRLERRMGLLAWLHHFLGYANTEALLADTQQVDEGFTPDGPSNIHVHFSTRKSRLKDISLDDLRRYDNNIATHLAAMNDSRELTITLRYFQYMAALYTEIYLDHYFRGTEGLSSLLNRYVRERNVNRSGEERFREFQPADLKKLAFWMATGSGKTLLFHLNYRQFLHYNKRHGQPPDNILLITPNEGLSRQHLEELNLSNIPARRFDMNAAVGGVPEVGLVQVTEITKLVEEKRGGGVRVPVETFEGNNLIFVDEGHKGAGGDAWRTMRDALGETGFTFEYSATFGQALAAADNDTLYDEYGKSIAFDYSYRHFYRDGYGKDFRILNLQQQAKSGDTDMLLLANMLSFYEQMRVFEEHTAALQRYHLECPLWVFVGGSVNAVYTKDGKSRSDVLGVAQFLHKVLSQRKWAISTIRKLLDGKSGLNDDAKRDIFDDKFDYLKNLNKDAGALYEGMLQSVMHTDSSSGLKLCPLRGHTDELGLKATGSDHYFGVIYIGDTAKFKKLVIKDDSGIILEEDALAGSLFDRVNDIGSRTPPIQVLIGARKFIEGWNSWRVSSMGLLNIGRSEGSQIIQLFGRGVRLRGRSHSLKRSAFLAESDQPHPPNIRLLETLNIFAVRADYMARFRGYLENEGVDVGDKIQLKLPIGINHDFLEKGLVIPRIPDDRQFQSGGGFLLRQWCGKPAPVSVVMTTVIQKYAHISPEGTQTTASVSPTLTNTIANSGEETEIPEGILDLVDWGTVYASLLEYKQEKGYYNLGIRPGDPRNIIAGGKSVYKLLIDPVIIDPGEWSRWNGQVRLQEAVTSILRRYTDALYRYRSRRWESDHLVYQPLDEQDANLRFNTSDKRSCYILHVPRNNKDLIAEIQRLIENCSDLYHNDKNSLPRIYFDRHLYQPLLIKEANQHNAVTMSPPGLEESEHEFVRDLRQFWDNNQTTLPNDMDLFLLRNLSRGSGVGFFTTSGFYPDFILWIKINDYQRIVFIEPHGMRYARRYKYDNKARLHEYLKKIAPKINEREDRDDIELDAYIVSATSHQELYEHYEEWSIKQFANKHILFPEANGDHLKAIFQFPLPPTRPKKDRAASRKASKTAKGSKR